MLSIDFPETGSDLKETGAAYLIVGVTPDQSPDAKLLTDAGLRRTRWYKLNDDDDSVMLFSDMARVFRSAFESLFPAVYVSDDLAQVVDLGQSKLKLTDFGVLLNENLVFPPSTVTKEAAAPSVFFFARVERLEPHEKDETLETELNQFFRRSSHSTTRSRLSDEKLLAFFPKPALKSLIEGAATRKAEFMILPEVGAWNGTDQGCMMAFYCYCDFLIYQIEEDVGSIGKKLVFHPVAPRNSKVIDDARRRMILIEKTFFSLSQSSYILRRKIANRTCEHLRLRAKLEWNRRLIGDMDRNVELETQKLQLRSVSWTNIIVFMLTALSVPVSVFFGFFNVQRNYKLEEALKVLTTQQIMYLLVTIFLSLCTIILLCWIAHNAYRAIKALLDDK
ncbi:MAG TPA: hypothetical protein VEH07_03405 [Alphaproteobacteria bacterium]|nr:hypothetical protein [Alphaproteobacteria bacterium]